MGVSHDLGGPHSLRLGAWEQSFIINFWTATLVVVVVGGEERLKDNLEMSHKEYILFLDKFRKFRYTQKRKPKK